MCVFAYVHVFFYCYHYHYEVTFCAIQNALCTVSTVTSMAWINVIQTAVNCTLSSLPAVRHVQVCKHFCRYTPMSVSSKFKGELLPAVFPHNSCCFSSLGLATSLSATFFSAQFAVIVPILKVANQTSYDSQCWLFSPPSGRSLLKA